MSSLPERLNEPNLAFQVFMQDECWDNSPVRLLLLGVSSQFAPERNREKTRWFVSVWLIRAPQYRSKI